MHAQVNHVEKKLCEKLVQFLQSEIKYTFRRVLPAEQAHLYVGPGAGTAKAETLKVSRVNHESTGTATMNL